MLNEHDSHNLYNEARSALQTEHLLKVVSTLNITPVLDGNQWCVLWGENLQVGISGFGNTPMAAISDFEKNLYQPITSPHP